MTEELKEEILEIVEKEVKFGFYGEENIMETIHDTFYDEDLDGDWLKQIIRQKLQAAKEESKTWQHPTDFERLLKAFDNLTREGIICLHKAGYTRQDAEGDCMEAMEELQSRGLKPVGFCYYHEQDLERAIESPLLLLGFGSFNSDEQGMIDVGRRIVEKLINSTFEINWNETADRRIEIRNMHWQKVAEEEEYGIDRSLQIALGSGNR